MKNAFKIALPLLVIGAAAGLLNGLLGAGGGIIIVFFLQLLYGKKVANGKSFFATAIAAMLPLSLFSVWRYARSGLLPTLPVAQLLLPSLLGGAVGALLLPLLPSAHLRRLFALVVLVSGVLLVI